MVEILSLVIALDPHSHRPPPRRLGRVNNPILWMRKLRPRIGK